MALKRDFWFPGSETEEARKIYVTGGEDVPDKVLLRFVEEWKEDATEVMALQPKGRAHTFTSSYDKKKYAVSRTADYALEIVSGFAQR